MRIYLDPFPTLHRKQSLKPRVKNEGQAGVLLARVAVILVACWAFLFLTVWFDRHAEFNAMDGLGLAIIVAIPLSALWFAMLFVCAVEVGFRSSQSSRD